MKRILIAALLATAPLSVALAESKDAAGAAKPSVVTGPEFPDWDQRKAGESVDLSGASDEKAK